jgi:hypothetical protein
MKVKRVTEAERILFYALAGYLSEHRMLDHMAAAAWYLANDGGGGDLPAGNGLQRPW